MVFTAAKKSCIPSCVPSILTFTLNKNYPFISARPQHFPAAIPLGASLPGVFSWNRISLFSICPNINLFPSLLFTNFTILIDLRLTPYFILKHELAPRLCHTAHCQDGLPVSYTGFFPDSPFSNPKRRDSFETKKDRPKKHDYAFSERFLFIFFPCSHYIHVVYRIQFPDPAGDPLPWWIPSSVQSHSACRSQCSRSSTRSAAGNISATICG